MGTSGGRPPSPEGARVGGQRVVVSLTGVRTRGGRPVAGLFVLVTAAGQSQPVARATVELAPGQSVTEHGVKLTLIDAYDLLNPAHEAADVVVTGAP